MPYRPYQLLPNIPMPPPVDASGQAIGVPVSGMSRPGLFNRFQMPGVLHALSQRHGLPQLGPIDHSKASAARHKLTDGGGLNIKALWKDPSVSGQRENSSSTHSTFLLGMGIPNGQLLLVLFRWTVLQVGQANVCCVEFRATDEILLPTATFLCMSMVFGFPGEDDSSADEGTNVVRRRICVRKHSRSEVGSREPPFRSVTSGLGASFKQPRYQPALAAFVDNSRPTHPRCITDNTSNLSLLADAAALVSSLESL